MATIKNIEWVGDAGTGHLRLLDQTRLPNETAYIDCTDVPTVVQAIKRLSVRGAPAIGIAAAYACVLALQSSKQNGDAEPQRRAHLDESAEQLAASRPTAVNLVWALRRMQRVEPCTATNLLEEARTIHEEDARMCREIGLAALHLIEKAVHDKRPAVITHCNAGALATGGIGTATAPIYLAHEKGLHFKVYADETRPLLQGSRLTAHELAAAGIDVTLTCDAAAAQVLSRGEVGLVITGADRIAANGDAANKIGTYGLAALARHHGVPFYIAAPSSTFDLSIPDGRGIPIEQRAPEEITDGFGRRTAPPGVHVYNPAFDVTPAELITGIVTEKGLIQPVNADRVTRTLRSAPR